MGAIKNQLIQDAEDDTFDMDFEERYYEMQQHLAEMRKESVLWKIVNFINKLIS